MGNQKNDLTLLKVIFSFASPHPFFPSCMNDKELPPIIVDKCFVQSSKPGDLQELAGKYTIVVTDGFYFEVFSELQRDHKKIFSEFPEFRRVDTDQLLRHEHDTLTPMESMDSNRLEVNPKVPSGEFVLNSEQQDCVKRYKSEKVAPQVERWNRIIDSRCVIGFEEKELKSVASDLPAFKRLCSRLHDDAFIRDIAIEMKFRHGRYIHRNWYTYRHIQTELLHALTLVFLSFHMDWKRDQIDLEHDVHDLDYLSLGLHARRFATNESRKNYKKLGWKFDFLCPDGLLLQSS